MYLGYIIYVIHLLGFSGNLVSGFSVLMHLLIVAQVVRHARRDPAHPFCFPN